MPDGAVARARPRTIALDGPAASGKSTVGARLAGRLGMLCFDTGLLYRALTVLALRAGVSADDAAALAALADTAAIDVVPDPGHRLGCRVTSRGDDVTDALHGPAVDAAVSAVSGHAAVRAALLGAQRRVAEHTAVIMLGRDIGTVVLPDADLKVYLDASPPARARRRYRERLALGEPAVYGDVLRATLERDARDAGRSIAPLAVAPDAVVVDTDRCDVESVVAHLAALVARWPDPLTTGGGPAPCEPPAASAPAAAAVA
ncbi:(d)CMP kinase [bacterium]|nr:MAG: (d)CMP kinase [bacterium]